MIGIFVALTVPELGACLDNSRLLKELMMKGSDQFNVDRAWDGLAHLIAELRKDLPEKAGPALEWLVFGDNIIDEAQDLGYGPARYLTPEQVKAVNEALDALAIEDLRLKYDSVRMNDLNIYPGFWDDEPGSFAFIATHYAKLRAFYSDACNEKKAVVMYIN